MLQCQRADVFCSSNISLAPAKRFLRLVNPLPRTRRALLNYSRHSLSTFDSSLDSNTVFMRQSIHGPCLHDSQLVASQNSRCFSSLALHIRHGKDRRRAGELPLNKVQIVGNRSTQKTLQLLRLVYFLFFIFFLSHSNLEEVLADILHAIIIISNYGPTVPKSQQACKSGSVVYHIN